MNLTDWLSWAYWHYIQKFPMRFIESYSDRVLQKGAKPHLLLSRLTGQIYFLQENVSVGFFENFKEFASYCAKKLQKFAQKFPQPFSCKKLNRPIKFGNDWWGLVPFWLTRSIWPLTSKKCSKNHYQSRFSSKSMRKIESQNIWWTLWLEKYANVKINQMTYRTVFKFKCLFSEHWIFCGLRH